METPKSSTSNPGLTEPSPILARVMEMTSSPHVASSIKEEKEDWWRGAVIYQIYPRSFQDHSGNGVGDLVGVIERLEYIAALGVDAIWLSPFFLSPMKDFGYDVKSHRQVDPLFGSLDDFDRLLSKAHSLGIKILIDMVISHTSDKHDWFVESRGSRTNEKADWYIWCDAKPDGSPPNNWLSIFGGVAWQWDSNRLQYYMHNFLACQPDLNFHCPAVQNALLSEIRFWLERGVDGVRLDTVNFYFHSPGLEPNPALKPEDFNDMTAPAVNPYNFQEHLYDKSRPENLEFLKRLRALLDEYPHRTSLGEVGDSQRQMELMAEYTSGPDRLHMAYTFDFLGGRFESNHFAEVIEKTNRMAPRGWMCVAFSNHDVMRHVSRWGPHLSATERDSFACLCISLLLCLRGSVCIYQGEELGLTEAELSFEDLVDPYGIEFWPKFKGRDGCRTPMPWNNAAKLGGFTSFTKAWLPLPTSHLDKAVNVQEAKEDSVLKFYRSMITFRRAHPALKTGSIEVHPSKTSDVLVFTRKAANEKLFCFFNMTATSQTVAFGRNVLGLDCPGSKSTEIAEGKLMLPPFSSYIGMED